MVVQMPAETEQSKLHVCTSKAVYCFALCCLSALISYPEILHHHHHVFSLYAFYAWSSVLLLTLVISQRLPSKTTKYVPVTCFKSFLLTDMEGEAPYWQTGEDIFLLELSKSA